MKIHSLLLTALTLTPAWRAGADPQPAALQAQESAADRSISRPDQPGPFKVGHLTDTATDRSRNRALKYDIWYPVNAAQNGGTPTFYDLNEELPFNTPVLYPSPLGAKERVTAASTGPFPLLVYSHASGGIRWENFDLCEMLASHGYVVISPDHTGAGSSGDDPNVSTGDRQDPLRNYRKRGADCGFMIETALARNTKNGDPLRGRINPERIGGFGWSMGGYSIASLAGEEADFCGDSRLDAMVLLSPSTWMLTPAELAKIEIPAVLLSGTMDSGIYPELTDAFVRLSGPHMLVSLREADHGTFSPWHLWQELIGSQPPDIINKYVEIFQYWATPEELDAQRELRRLTTLYTVAGFDRYLKNSGSAANWLAPSYARAHEPNIAEVRVGVSPDLNGNDVVDSQDIAQGRSRDANRNGIPDEVEGPVIRVRAGWSSGNGTGSSWANAAGDLRKAIELAKASRNRVKEIWVAKGTYTPERNTADMTSMFQIRNIAIYGGFAGHETSREQRNPAANVTVLSGDLRRNDRPSFVNREDNVPTLVTLFRSSTDAVLDGFTVSGAAYNGIEARGSGAFRNCLITDNQGEEFGGGMRVYGGTVALEDSVFLGNRAKLGGALYVTDGSVTMAGCRLEDNRALNGPYFGSGSAGAVLAYSNAHLHLQNCTIRNNTAHTGSTLVIYPLASPSSLTAVNCLLQGNATEDWPGSPGSASALYVGAGQQATLTNITSYGNASTGKPWFVYGDVAINNSIIRDGTAWLDGTAALKYSNFPFSAAISGGTGNISSDPKFTNPAAGDFRLKSGSPCINKGKSELLPADLLDLDGDGNLSEKIPWDLSGLSRIAGGSVDMGAFEAR